MCSARSWLKWSCHSGAEHTSRAFRNVVHFFCRVRAPPTSPWQMIRGHWRSALPSPASRAPSAHGHGLLYLADAGHTGHHLLRVAVILHGPLAKEEVDLVVIAREAPQAFRDIGRADKMRFCGKGRRLREALVVTPPPQLPQALCQLLTIEPEGQVLCLHGVMGPHVTHDNRLRAQEVVECGRVQLAIYKDRGSARPEGK